MNPRTAMVALVTTILTSPVSTLADEVPSNTRTWRDATGKHRVIATLVKVDNAHAWLKKQSGAVKQVPLEKLSEPDRRFAAEQGGSEKANVATAASAALKAMHSAAGANAWQRSARQWMDNSGQFRTEASLVAADENKVTLRKPSGRLIDVPFSRLSDRDRVFVQEYLDGLSKGGVVPPVAAQVFPKVKEIIDGETPVALAPPDEIRIRLGQAYLDRRFGKPIDKQAPVRDVIMDTPIRGNSDIHGTVRLVPRQSDDSAALFVIVSGRAASQTVGTHHPVWIYSAADTQFRGTKRLFVTPEGIKMEPAKVTATTHSRTTGISTSLPRLRGRIAQRIAWRRVNESRATADRISSERNQARIARDIDRQVAESIARTDKFLSEQQTQMRTALGLEALEVSSRSTEKYVEFRFGNSPNMERSVPPEFTGETDVEIVMHAPSLAGAINENGRMLLTNLANALLDNVLERRAENKGTAELNCRLVWSRDQQWLTVIADREPAPRLSRNN